MTTIKDVARDANVSTSTVSHVLNKTRYVSEEVSARVQASVEKLCYTPSALARSLKTQSTKTFGMLVTSSTNPFFGEVLKGVELRCYESGYNLIICNTEDDVERMHANLDLLLQKHVDGLILLCSDIEKQGVNLFERHKPIPIVVMDWGPTNFPCDKIRDNSHRGGYMATQHLIANGHTEIGCITGILDKLTAQHRFAGYTQAMQEAKLTINPDWVVEGDFECDGGEKAFTEMYSNGPLPSALFVCNDMMAMSVINIANKKGISVPEDLSIIGYDDIQLAKYITPSLTTIHQPKHHLGKKAVERLLAQINSKTTSNQIIELEPTLVKRDSVKTLN